MRFLWVALLLGLPPRGGLAAQARLSEAASVSQTVDGARITVTYSRPRARGRDSLFGRVVRWGLVWTPGANMATTLEVSKDVRLDGNPVPKGKYSVWMVVRDGGEWTFVLDPRAELFHTVHPDSTADQIRLPIRTEERPFIEVLTWWFPEVTPTGVTLALQWGTRYVPIVIEVDKGSDPVRAPSLPSSQAP